LGFFDSPDHDITDGGVAAPAAAWYIDAHDLLGPAVVSY
jgi:hypothetical protein